MAVHRNPPICPKCNKPIKAIHKKVNKAFTFIGDTFERWDWDGHKCQPKETKERTKNIFQKGKSYLIKSKYSMYSQVFKVKVIEITEKCYQMQWDSGNKTFEEISRFDKENIIIENL